MTVELGGFVYNVAGTAVSGANISIFDRNTVTPAITTTTTDSNGFWSVSAVAEGRYDVQIVDGSSTSRIKYDDEVQLLGLETAALSIRNPADTFTYDIIPGAITGSRTVNLPVITANGETFVVTGTALADGADITWGAGSDVRMKWDSSDFIIDMNSGGEFIFNSGAILLANGENIDIGHIVVVARSSTSPTNALNIFNGDAPGGTLANGVTLYSKDVGSSAEPHVMNEAGVEGRIAVFGGGLRANHQILAANTNLTVDQDDSVISVTLGSSSDNTITLPAAAGNEGMLVHVYVTDGTGSNNAVVTRAGSDTISNGSGDLSNTTVTLGDTGDFVFLQVVNSSTWTVVHESGTTVG